MLWQAKSSSWSLLGCCSVLAPDATSNRTTLMSIAVAPTGAMYHSHAAPGPDNRADVSTGRYQSRTWPSASA
eukprot:2128468-Rhodomonas_salina.1